MGERQWDEPKLRFPPVLWLCLRGPAREEHSRTYHYLQEAARTAPGKNPEREKRGGGRHQGGPWAVPIGSGAAEAAGKPELHSGVSELPLEDGRWGLHTPSFGDAAKTARNHHYMHLP